MIADVNLPAEDDLIDLPVPLHFSTDTKTIVEQKSDIVDGVDCPSILSISSATRGDKVSLLLIVPLNRVENSDVVSFVHLKSSRQYFDNYSVRGYLDPIFYKSWSNTVDADWNAEAVDAVNCIVESVILIVIPSDDIKRLVAARINVFRTSTLSGPMTFFAFRNRSRLRFHPC